MTWEERAEWMRMQEAANYKACCLLLTPPEERAEWMRMVVCTCVVLHLECADHGISLQDVYHHGIIINGGVSSKQQALKRIG